MTLIEKNPGIAMYEMLCENGGQTYTFPVVCIKDDNGNWKILNF